MADTERPSILERLEQEFEHQKGQEKQAAQEKKRPGVKHWFEILGDFFAGNKKKVAFGTIAAVLAVAGIGLAVHFSQLRGADTPDIRKELPDFLTKEERTDWKNKEVDTNEIYIFVNSNLDVQEKNSVELRLANPPYCAYPLKITITDSEDAKKIYYESPVLKPGDSIETAKFTNLPKEAGTYSAAIRYEFYGQDAADTVVGEHMVGAELLIH